MKKNELMNEMLKNCVHLGHGKKYLNNLMKPYIMNNVKSEMSIIDLDISSFKFYRFLKIIEQVIELKKIILIVCTKKQTRNLIKIAAKSINMPYVNKRWLGGTLTNFVTIKRTINKMNYIENIIKNKKKLKIKKKKLSLYIRKLKKFRKFLEGIRNLRKLPDFIFCIDAKHHKNTVIEAKKMQIPIACIVDTNTSPLNIDIVIPGNDDFYKSIIFYLKYLTETINNKRLEIYNKKING